MITATSSSTLVRPIVEHRPMRLLSWGAIFAGALVALGLHGLLTMLGLGLGVRWVSPLTNADPAQDFTVAAGVVWALSALVALWVGGWVAGRSVDVGDRNIGRLHGFVVWALATVVMAGVLTGGAGMAAAGAVEAAGKTTRTVLAAGAASNDSAANGWLGAVGGENAGLVSGLMDDLGAENGTRLTAMQKRDVALATVGFFARSTPERRSELIASLTAAGLAPAAAERTVANWERSYAQMQSRMEELRADAEQAAREAAARASRVVAQAAVWTFIAFVVGAVAAMWGGHAGALAALRSTGTDVGLTEPPRADPVR